MTAMLKYAWINFFLFMFFYGYTQPCDTAKGFQTMYRFKNVDNFGTPSDAEDWGIKKIIEDKNGNIVTWSVIQFVDANGAIRKNKMICKTTPKGTPLWVKRFEDNNAINNISPTNDNGYMVMLGVASESILVKLTPDGTVQWSSHLSFKDKILSGGGGASVIQLNNGNYIRVGRTETHSTNVINGYGFISCIDKDGGLLWNKYFDDAQFSKIKYAGGSGNDAKVIELQDGNLLVSGWNNYTLNYLNTGNTQNNTNTNISRFYLQKLNASTGTIIFSTFLVPKDSTGWLNVSFDIHELSDRSIHVHVNRYSYIPGYPAPPSNTYYHFDAAGKFIEGKTIQLKSPGDSLASYYAGTDAQGNDVFYGEVTGNASYHTLFKESEDMVTWAKSYHSSLGIGSLKKITTAMVGNNAYILGGQFITHNFSGNSGNDEYQNYLIKTDALGNTNCSDTFSIPFVIVKADTVVQYPATWAEKQGMTATRVKMVNADLLPYDIRDCLVKNRCCNDTIRYANNVICNLAAYTLPDNTSVTQPGIYSNYFQTAKGCDSVIFTTLTQAGIPSIELGNDTCLTDSSKIMLYPKTGNSAFSSFLWQDGSRDSSYTIKTPGLYWVKATSACGTVSDSIMIYSDCNLPIYIPTAFTPNGDGLNDVFRISDMRNQELIDFSIYNRFGQQIFKTNNPKKGWNGKLNAIDQPISTFVYLVRYKDLTGKLQSVKGTVTLLR